MKQLLSIALISLICFSVNHVSAQDQKTDRKARREARKAQEALLSQEEADLLTKAIDSSTFVLEANRLQGKRGVTINVSSSLNFVAVNGKSAFIQIGSNSGIGPNGVGGVSVDTRITNMEVTKNKRNNGYSIQLTCMASSGSYNVFITTNSDGQIASATIRGNWGRELNYYGNLVPLNQSTVYKGTPRF